MCKNDKERTVSKHSKPLLNKVSEGCKYCNVCNEYYKYDEITPVAVTKTSLNASPTLNPGGDFSEYTYITRHIEVKYKCPKGHTI